LRGLTGCLDRSHKIRDSFAKLGEGARRILAFLQEIESMRLRYFYLLFCVIGTVLPYSQFMPWISEHGFNLALFFHELFANRVGGFFGLDVVVSAIVLIIFVQVEGRQLGMRRLWIPMVGTLLAGVSFGFPLFLYLREIQLNQNRI
jgi:hypothetical protein